MPFSQRFVDHLLPLSDLVPSAGHLAIAGLDLRIGPMLPDASIRI
jgi:hypothetical protein